MPGNKKTLSVSSIAGIEKTVTLGNEFFDKTPGFFWEGIREKHFLPVVEETYYYPFGLTMAGISSKALTFGNPENKLKYNGIEKENDLQIEIYDAQLRELDGQIGRWWQVDPETESMEMWSPYTSNYDNPITYMDILGDEPDECCGGLGELIDEVLISGSGVVNGTLNTISFGAISSDPFNFRSKLNDEQRQTYDRGVIVGKTGAGLMPFAPSRRPPPMQLVPAGGSGKGGPVIVEAPPGKLGPVTTVQSNSNSSGNANKNTTQNQVKQSKVEKSTKVEQVGDFTKKTKVEPSKKSPGQSRAEYVTYKNKDGKVIRTYKDSYDRGNKFQGRKPLRGGPEGRPNN